MTKRTRLSSTVFLLMAFQLSLLLLLAEWLGQTMVLTNSKLNIFDLCNNMKNFLKKNTFIFCRSKVRIRLLIVEKFL